ncbi:MAG: IS200/IS605 family transposase [Rhodospirillaceae bacterium]|nr:IS200/IS605 family transposase [Rhodospirillaceae bacterium]
MPQSLSAIYLHLIFSTKGRRPWLADDAVRTRLHAYLAAASGVLDCPAIEVGGVADHVHVLVRLGRQVAIADLVKELKRVTSRWLKTQSAELGDFQWQGGYAAFSVSVSNVKRVGAYIAGQPEHHARYDFRGELEALLRRHGVEWDERYLWD